MSSAEIVVRREPTGDGSGGGSGLPVPSPGAKTPNAFTPGSAPGGGPASAPGPVAVGGAPGEAKPKIQAFSQGMGAKRHSENWKRKTNLTGQGATHVRSFHCKLNSESLEYMDQQINEWLDSHPDYEVKMVTTAVGEWTGKIKEPALIVHVWV